MGARERKRVSSEYQRVSRGVKRCQSALWGCHSASKFVKMCLPGPMFTKGVTGGVKGFRECHKFDVVPFARSTDSC